MSLMRWCTMVRYGYVFRLGFMTYILFALLLLVVWTYHGRAGDALDKMVEHMPDNPAQHTHRRIEDLARPQDDIVVVKGKNRDRGDLPVFTRREYASNHSHPVEILPPKAGVVAQQKPGEPVCQTPRMVDFFSQRLVLAGDPVCAWLDKAHTMADGRFVQYGDKMALLYDVVLDPGARGSGAKGGEKMEEVWGQSEDSEYMKLQEGFFTLQCKTKPAARFGAKDHLGQWVGAVRCVDNASISLQQPAVKEETNGEDVRVPGLTIALQRYEYVNLYHTMTDFYNAFLAMLVFNQHPDDVSILWVDAHPQGGLDDVWDNLFGKVYRAGRLPGKTRFHAMAWAAMGYNSPLNEHSRPSVPFLEEFRHFFLSRHGVKGDHRANCSSLSFLLVWRRDYTAHPRNKGGSISRKIDNEDELVTAVRQAAGGGDSVRGLQLDALPMAQQLELIAATDVLVGMHGAGLSHTLLLPPTGGLLELYPTYWPQANRHFRAMAAWRGLHYQNWQNHEAGNEKPNHRTYVPPEVVSRMVKEMRRNICG